MECAEGSGQDFELLGFDLGVWKQRLIGIYRVPGLQLSSELAEIILEETVEQRASLVFGDLNMDLKRMGRGRKSYLKPWGNRLK